jgi:uncharacterized lipoprotein YddW (UPF0748 family)
MNTRWIVIGLAMICAAHGLGGTARPERPAASETRGLWVLRSSLTSHASIASMVAAARSAGINTLLVQVRARGDAYFDSRVEPRARALAGQPASFDPLADVLREGRAAGLKIHAWVSVNLVADAGNVPADARHVVNRHPEWLMVPLELSATIGSPHARGFLGRLASWTRARHGAVEGLFLSPIAEGAARHVAAVVEDLAARYDVDGVHLDYVRYPGPGFDYSQEALAAFRSDAARGLARADRQALDRQQRNNPFAWVQAYPQRWEDFRRRRLTALVERLRRVVKLKRPRAVFSAAVLADPRAAVAARFQDWPAWAAGGLLDAVCPMAYVTDDALFRQQIDEAGAAAGGRPLWVGIGAYRLSGDQVLRQIGDARASRVDGVILFSYDSLVGAARGADNLSRIGAQAFGQ